MNLNVAVTLRITPESIDTDLEKIVVQLGEVAEKYGKLHSSEIKPIAFGLNCIETSILMDDSKGGVDGIEEDLRAIEGVSEIDILDVNRL